MGVVKKQPEKPRKLEFDPKASMQVQGGYSGPSVILKLSKQK